MFDIGWTEMLVLGIVTLLVVGPRELPGLLRMIGRYVGHMRDVANEFRSQFNDISDEMDVKAELKRLTQEGFDMDMDAPDLFAANSKDDSKDAPKDETETEKEKSKTSRASDQNE